MAIAPCAPPTALRISGGSAVHLFDCTIEGTASEPFGCLFGICYSPGGDALALASAADWLYLSGCTIRGGLGSCGIGSGGAGGDGLVVAAGAKAIVLDSLLEGGPQGTGTFCGPAGTAQVGSVEFLGGESLAMIAPGAVRAGGYASFVLRGAPATAVYLLGVERVEPLYRRPWRGPLIGTTPVSFFFLGQTDASGLLRVERRQPPLPAGVLFERVYQQALQLVPGTLVGSVRGAHLRAGAVTSSIALAPGL